MMKHRGFIIICFIVLFTFQVVPIKTSINEVLERDSGQAISQGIESSAIPDPPKVLKYISPPSSIEYDMIPNYAIYPATMVFDPLVEYSFDSGEPTPALAKQWVVTNDSKHWIFTLRDDVTFHDGTKFNASSVKFTYDRLIDPNHTAYVANPVAEISGMPLESVEILDEYKVSINFNQSYAPFIYQEAAYIGIYSPNSFGGGSNLTEPIGTGPYDLDEIASSPTFQKFIRNDQHFRGVPPFEEVQFVIYSSWEAYQAAVIIVQDGNFATLTVDTLPESDSYWEESLAFDTMHYGVFNHLHSIMDDPNVRLAINYAINNQLHVDQDYRLISENVKSQRSIIFSGDPFHDESIQGYPYNVELANSILDNAGYTRNSNGDRFSIKLVGWNYDELEVIKDELDLIGIRCIIVTGSYSELINDLESGSFDLFIIGWAPLMDPSVISMLLHTSGAINWGNYSNSEFDLYTTLGQQTPVKQEREYYYYQAQRIAQEEAPLLLIMETKRVYLRATNVTPFIQLSKDGRMVFNYDTQGQDADIYTMEDIEVSSDPIYFPFTDGIVALEAQQVEGNMSMTHELSNLIPNQQEAGKFYELRVNNSDLGYNLRCYYDLDEIDYSDPLEEQDVFLWNYSTESWNKLEIVASNANLRFSEIQLKGNAILRLGQINLILLTFKYLPIIILVIGPIVALGSFITIKNRKLMKKFKEECDVV